MRYEIEWFDSFDEADRADRAYRMSLTPKERIEMLLQMIADYYGPSRRLERVAEIIELDRS